MFPFATCRLPSPAILCRDWCTLCSCASFGVSRTGWREMGLWKCFHPGEWPQRQRLVSTLLPRKVCKTISIRDFVFLHIRMYILLGFRRSCMTVNCGIHCRRNWIHNMFRHSLQTEVLQHVSFTALYKLFPQPLLKPTSPQLNPPQLSPEPHSTIPSLNAPKNSGPDSVSVLRISCQDRLSQDGKGVVLT